MHLIPSFFAATRGRSNAAATGAARDADDPDRRGEARSTIRAADWIRRLGPWVLVFVVALVIRLAYMEGQARNNPLFDHPIMDSAMHDLWAKHIAMGEGVGAKPYFRAPLYYYLLAGLYALFGASTMVGAIAGCIMGAANAALIGMLGDLLGGRRVGWTAGIAAIFYWPLIYYDAELLSVSLEILLNLLTLWFLLTGAARNSYRRWALAGIFLGLSAITRPTVLTFVAVLVAWVVIFRPMGQRRLDNLKAVALALGACALVILPVTIRNRVVGGEWVLVATNGGVNFYIGNNSQSNGYAAIVPGTRRTWEGGYEDTHRLADAESGRTLTESEVSDFWYHKAWRWIGDNPGAWTGLLWLKVRLFFSAVEIPNNQPITQLAELSPVAVLFLFGFPLVAPLAAAGLLAVRERRGAWFLVVAAAVVSTATTILYFCNSRYRLVIVPQLLWLASAGAWMCVDWLRARRWRAVAAYGAIVILAAAFILTNPPDRAQHNASVRGETYWVLGQTYYRMATLRPPRVSPDVPASYLRQAAELRPGDPDVRLWYGMSLLLNKQPQQAEQQFVLATAGRGTPEAHLYYGRFLEEGKRYREAAAQYEQALALLPTMREARDRLNALRARGAAP